MKSPLFLLVMVCMALVSVGWAEAAGSKELSLITGMLTGNLGFALGLIVAVMGIFMFIGGNTGGGLFMVILGVLITLIPAVFNTARTLFCPMVAAMTGNEAKCEGGYGE